MLRYEKVLNGKLNDSWHPSRGRWMKEMELNAMKKESEVWMLMKRLSEERMKRLRDKKRKDSKNRSELAFHSSGSLRLDDKLAILDALDHDEILKEMQIIVEWLENVYGGRFNDLASNDMINGILTDKNASGTSLSGFTSRKSASTFGMIGGYNAVLVASEGPANASKLDLNGKEFKMIHTSLSKSSNDHDNGQDSSSSSSLSSNPDHVLSQHIWKLFRGGRMEIARNMLVKSGQTARFSTFFPLASGISGAFTDPHMHSSHVNSSYSSSKSHSIPANSLSNMSEFDFVDSDLSPPSQIPSGIIQRSLMKDTLSSIIAMSSLSDRFQEETRNGQSSSSSNSPISLDPFERALYACLSGTMNGVLPVCESWEDFVWVFLKTWLNQRVENILSSGSSNSNTMEGQYATNYDARRSGRGEILIWSVSPSSSSISSNGASNSSSLVDQVLSATLVSSSSQSRQGRDREAKSALTTGQDEDISEETLLPSSSSSSITDLGAVSCLPVSKSFDTILQSVIGSSIKSKVVTSSSSSSFNYSMSTLDSETMMNRLAEYFASLESGKLPNFDIPGKNFSTSNSSTTSSLNVLKRVSMEAKEAFRRVESLIILQDWQKLFQYLRRVCKGVSESTIEEEEGDDVTTLTEGRSEEEEMSKHHGNNPTHILRFAAHMVLLIETLYPSLYDDEEEEDEGVNGLNIFRGEAKSSSQKSSANKLQRRKSKSATTTRRSSTSSTSSSIVDDASFIISKYVEHLMEKEGRRHLVAQYCARMPRQRKQEGYDMYVTMMRRIRTTKERQQAMEMAMEAGMDTSIIASLLVEDIINEPIIMDNKHQHQQHDEKNQFTSTGGKGMRIGKSTPSSSHHHHATPFKTSLTSRIDQHNAMEGVTTTTTPSKQSNDALLRLNARTRRNNDDGDDDDDDDDGVGVTREGANRKAHPSSFSTIQPHSNSSLLSLLSQHDGVEYLSRIIAIASSCPSRGSSSSSSSSSSSVSPQDSERIHALEWLALSDSDEKQKLLCLKHANALARGFLLSSSFVAARLLFDTVNNLLSGLFSKHKLNEEENDGMDDDDSFTEEDDEEKEMVDENEVASDDDDYYLNNNFSSSPRALLKEYMSLSLFLESIEAFSRWYHEGFGKSKSSRWISRSMSSSSSSSSSSSPLSEFDLFDSYDTDSETEGNVPSLTKKKQKGEVGSFSSSSSLFQSTAAEAIQKLGQVIYYPSGWLTSSSSSAKGFNGAPSHASKGLRKMPSKRSQQLSLLLQLCLPSTLLLLQHTLLCSSRLSDAVLLCNDLASETQKLFLHFSPTSIKAFLVQVHLASLFHLKTPESSQQSNTPFPF
jgi:hypothetical protein